MSGSDDYEVGYKKPPLHTRFQKDGGSKKGRGGRTSRNLKTDLTDELAERITLKSNGKPVRLTQQRALVRSLVVNGIKGDTRATAKVFDLVLRLLGSDEKTDQADDISEQDQAILDSFLKREGGDDGAQ